MTTRPDIFQGWIDWAQSRRLGHRLQSRPSSRTPAADGLPWPIATAASVGSGSITGSPAARSAQRSARRWARPASQTSGFPTATRTARSTARGLASGLLESLDAIFAESIDPRNQPRRRREQALRPRVESYMVGSHEFYLGLRDHPRHAPLPRCRPFPPDGDRSPTRSPPCSPGSTSSSCTSAAGVRWDSDHVVTSSTISRRSPGGGPRRLPRPGPRRARLLRRQHQPRRRLGHRHPDAAQGGR